MSVVGCREAFGCRGWFDGVCCRRVTCELWGEGGMRNGEWGRRIAGLAERNGRGATDVIRAHGWGEDWPRR